MNDIKNIISGKTIDCLNRDEIPNENENIFSEVGGIIETFPAIDNVNVYERSKEACPFARGNWLIDINYINGSTFCIKLPLKMSLKQVQHYCQPLLDLLKSRGKSKLN